MTDIVDTSGVDRRGKPCRCCHCGIVAICKPDFDFYTYEVFADVSDFLSQRPLATPLYCERCYRANLESEGVKTDLMLPIGDPEVIT